jgi:arylsulfatase A-like enzyme
MIPMNSQRFAVFSARAGQKWSAIASDSGECGNGNRLHAGLLFASIAALFCSTLEVDILKQLDSLSLYLTYGEIALDAGTALLILLGIAALWWLFTLTFVRMANLIPRMNRYARPLAWYLGLTLSFGYFLLDMVDAVNPQWHPGLLWGGLFVSMLVTVCVGAVSRIGLSRLQDFSRTRLAPITWVHIGLAVIAVIVLRVDGVHLFHDYTRTGKAVANSQYPDIYLITTDALRADDTSLYGYALPTTPSFQRFSQRSFTFDHFFANSNFTTSATTSIETGKLPWSHRVFHLGAFLRGAAQHEHLAAALHEHRYYTAMITSNLFAAPFRHRTIADYDSVEYAVPLGVVGKWLQYTNLIGADTQYTLRHSLLERLSRFPAYADALMGDGHYPYPAEAVFDRARRLLDRSDIAQPRFVWIHIAPPHDPYLPPPPYRMHFLPTNKLTRWDVSFFLSHDQTALPPGVSAADVRARYDEMVLYADHAVGDFLDWLDHTGRLDRAIVIVSSDHGESFEHNWFRHGGPHLYNGLVHIPLLIHLPEQRRGARISQLAQQADLLPTILDLIGAPIPSWTDGISLKPALEGRPVPQRFIFSMNLAPNRVFDSISKGTVAVMDDEFKYVNRLDSQQDELYRYTTDQWEEHNLIGSEPGVAKRMRDVLFNKLKEVNKRFASKL